MCFGARRDFANQRLRLLVGLRSCRDVVVPPGRPRVPASTSPPPNGVFGRVATFVSAAMMAAVSSAYIIDAMPPQAARPPLSSRSMMVLR